MGVLIDSAATVPDVVRAAQSRAARISFELSSEDLVGRLLAVLAAATPASGRILEIGTGVGVGTSWLLAGLAGRVDVEVVSVEANPSLARVAQDYPWPSFVRLLTGSIFELYEELGQFDLIFADSGAGKWQGLDRTLGALQPGGLLVMDDMTPPRWHFAEHEALNKQVREELVNHPDLRTVELPCGSGVLLCTRRRFSGTE